MEIGVLGAVEVWHGGERLPVGPPQQRCVLAVLALNAGQGVSVERLSEALWGEEQPADARGLVHGYISRLRKVLEPTGLRIGRRSPGYGLEVEPTQVDLHLFRRLVTEARAESAPDLAALGLFKALALWRGEPLDGVSGSEVLDRVRAGLDQERLAVTEEWVEHELELGRHREVVGELTALCADHPYQEKLVGLLMLALHRCGRQAEALRRYEECRRLLADTLGVDPGDDLRTLYERILRSDPALTRAEPPVVEPVKPAKTPNSLPFDVPDFTGRAAEVARLLDAVADRGAVISVDGMAGVGKTALVVRVAHALAERCPDGRLFVDLHGFTPSREPVEPAAALGVLLRSIGLPPGEIPAELDDRIALWRTEMAGRKAVVVLDNAVDVAQVRPLIPGSPGCVVIVTSRKRLATLDGALPVSLDVLPPAEAEELFRLVAGNVRADEGAEVAELVRLCGYLPLAVRVAGARLRHRPRWTVTDLVERLRTEQQRLSELVVDDRDVAAAFALSYRHLDADQQRVFRLLSVQPGVDVDVHTAAAITGLRRPRAEDLLEDLLDHHLLEQRTRDRFQFHDLLREHALGLLGPADATAEAGVRLLDYYLSATDRAADALQPGRRRVAPKPANQPLSLPSVGNRAAAMGWYAAEHQNLVAATAFAVRNGYDRHVCELPRNIGNYLVIGHHIDDLVAIQEPAADAARRLGDPPAESIGLSHLALTYYMAGRYRLGERHTLRNLELARELGDRTGEGYALGILGLLYQRLGRYAEARDCNHEAITTRERSGDQRLVAICTANLGRIELALGDAAQAWELLDKALALTREIEERSEEASVLSGLGAAASRLGEHDQALRLLYEGLELAREVGNTDYTVRGTVKLADGHRRAGHLDRALVLVEQVVGELRRSSAIDHLATASNVLGAIHADAGRVTESHAAHSQALELARRIEYRIEHARALEGLGAQEEAAEHYRAMGVCG
jgi:DNA-binding SARP family transcriptional activator/tetratricopeptide (TPR) repeat protein